MSHLDLTPDPMRPSTSLTRGIYLLMLLLLLLAYAARAAPRRREIDLKQLEADLLEPGEEDEEWHEDGLDYDTRLEEQALAGKTMAERMSYHQRPQDPGEVGRVQGTFVFLKSGTCAVGNTACAIQVAQKYASLLQTGGVTVSAYPIKADQLLMTNTDGKWVQMKSFLLNQPEVRRLHWDGQDFWAPGVVPGPAEEAGDAQIPEHLRLQDRDEHMADRMRKMGMEKDASGAWVKVSPKKRKNRKKAKKSKKKSGLKKKKRKRKKNSHNKNANKKETLNEKVGL